MANLTVNQYESIMTQAADKMTELYDKVARLESEKSEQAADIAQLREALSEPCRYHHLPLINGWAHSISIVSGSKKTVRCPLSKKARKLLNGGA